MDNDGRTIHLENVIYVRSARRSFSRGTFPIAAFMDTYRTMEASTGLGGYSTTERRCLPDLWKVLRLDRFGTISLFKNVGYSVALLVNFESRQVEVFDSHGCDMNN